MVRQLPRGFSVGAPGPAALIIVTVDWCSHCRDLKPKIPAIERALGSTARVYTVDGDAQPARVREFGVDGFPTILYKATNGTLYTYNGPRDPRSIRSFIQSV